MEYAELLRQLPAALIPFAIVFYFYQQLSIRVLQERKELAEAIKAERKEWLEERKIMLERQFSLDERMVTELSNTRGENHAGRGRLTEFILKVDGFITRAEAFFARIEKVLTFVENYFGGRADQSRRPRGNQNE